MLAASREKQAELQRQCDLLTRKYTALQSSLLDMKTETKPSQLRIETSNASEAEQGSFSVSTSPVMMKTRPPRMLSSPDVAEGTAFNVTPPLDQRLEAAVSPKSGGWAHPPGSPDTSSLSMSPDQLRFGRGETGRLLARSHSDLFATATQNRLRKDSKDKGKDEASAKKDKKPSALRGIRGFMYE
jgi:hypothetical protein